MRASCIYTLQRIVFLGLAMMFVVTGCGEGNLSEAELIQRGIEYREEGNHRASVIELKNALQKNPSNVEGRWQLGLTYLAMRSGSNAETEIMRARELGMPAEKTVAALAKAQVLQGRYDQALAMLDDDHVATIKDPRELAQVYLIQGLAQLGKRQLEDAARLLGMALEKKPDLIDAILGQITVNQIAGNIEEAGKWVDEALALAPENARVLKAQGDLARIRGDLAAAETAYSQAIEASRTPFEFYHLRALVRLERDNLEGFEEDLESMRRISAEHPMTNYLSGLWHSRKQEYEQAQTDFETVLSYIPDHQPTIYLLGATHFALEHWNQAKNYLRRYLAEHPAAAQAAVLLARIHVQEQQYDNAVRVLDQAMASSETPQPMLSEMLASVYLQQGQREKGMEVLRRALNEQPDSASLQELLGMALLEGGERDAGLEALRRSSELDDAPRRTETALILAHLQASEFKEALEAAQRYHEKQPDSVQSYNFIGAAQAGLQHYDEARQAFTTALELDPDNQAAALNLGNMEMHQGRLEAARELFTGIQERHPGHSVSAQRLAVLELQQGKPEAAERWLKDSLNTHPENLPSRLMLARIQMMLGESQQALQTLDQALEYHPRHISPYLAKAGLLQTMGRSNEALQVLFRAEEAAPDSAEVQRRLARAREQSGDSKAMLAHLRKAVELEPGHIPTRVSLTLALAETGAKESARKQLLILQDKYGEHAEVMALSGWFALRDGNPKASAAAYEKALDKRLHRPWIMELVRAKEIQGDLAGAVSVLSRWLEYAPGDRVARHLLANHQIAMGNTDAAIENYETLLKAAPENVTALNNLAWLLRERDTDRALALVEKARAQAPDSGAVQDTLGVVLYFGNKLDESARVLRELTERYPEQPALRFHLARTLHAMGDDAGAKQHLDRALASNLSFAERPEAERLQHQLTQ